MPIKNGRIVDWKYNKDIKQFLDKEDAVECLMRTANSIKDELLDLQDLDEDMSLGQILDCIIEAGEDNDVEYFDRALDDLYDWADYNLVWLGMPQF